MFVYRKCYILIELTFLKELILIKQVHQKSVIFVTIGRYHNLLMMSMNLSDIAILNIKSADYCCIIRLLAELPKMRP